MRSLVLLAAALLCAACGTSSLYYWGDYEDSVLTVSSLPDGFDVDEQIDLLETQVEQSNNKGLGVPPGLHAHLAYLYSFRGDIASARNNLLREKELFPESAVFVDGLIARLDTMQVRS